MPNGIDINCTVQNISDALTGAQLEFVDRYYALRKNKRLQRVEAQTLSAAGIQTVAIWETARTAASYF
jgi:hypothetical protein